MRRCGARRLIPLPAALLLRLFDLALETRNLPLEVLSAGAVPAVILVVTQVADLDAVPLPPARCAVGPALAGEAVGNVDAARVDLGGQEAGPRLVNAQPRPGDPIGVLVLVLVEFVV